MDQEIRRASRTLRQQGAIIRKKAGRTSALYKTPGIKRWEWKAGPMEIKSDGFKAEIREPVGADSYLGRKGAGKMASSTVPAKSENRRPAVQPTALNRSWISRTEPIGYASIFSMGIQKNRIKVPPGRSEIPCIRSQKVQIRSQSPRLHDPNRIRDGRHPVSKHRQKNSEALPYVTQGSPAITLMQRNMKRRKNQPGDGRPVVRNYRFHMAMGKEGVTLIRTQRLQSRPYTVKRRIRKKPERGSGRAAARQNPSQKSFRPESKNKETKKRNTGRSGILRIREAQSWNPVIFPHHGLRWKIPVQTGNRKAKEKAPDIRKPEKSIRKKKSATKRISSQAAWDSLDTKTKEKIARKAIRIEHRYGRRHTRTGRINRYMSYKLAASDSGENEKDRMDPTVKQLYGVYYGKRISRQNKRWNEKKYGRINRRINRMARAEARKQEAKKEAKKRRRLKAQTARFRETSSADRPKKYISAAKNVALGAVKAARTVIQAAVSGLGAICAPVIVLLLALVLILLILAAITGGIASTSPGGIDGTEIAAYAASFEGKIPYLLGAGREYSTLEEIVAAGGMSDCSAFTERVFRHFNAEIGSTTYQQQNAGTEVAGSLEPGDLLLFDNHLGGQQPGHVGIYMGDGKVIHEGGGNYTGNVKINDLSAFTVMSVRRIAVTASDADFSGENVRDICYHFFTSQGFSMAATCGILGNIQWESGFQPGILEQGGADSGHGLCQWGDAKTGGRFYELETFAAQQGTAWTDVPTQLLFVIYELNGSVSTYFNLYAGGVEAYKNMADPAEAALVWLKCYEMCGPYDAEMANESSRVASAWEFYNLYGGG